MSYAQSNAGLRLVYHVTLMLAAVTQHAAIRSTLPPRAPTTAADDFAFCVYAVRRGARGRRGDARARSPRASMSRRDRRHAGAKGPRRAACASRRPLYCIFVHARPPISLEAPLAVAVMLVFCGAAALACARRMLHKPGGDPGGAYARVGSSDVRRQSSLQENLLDDDDYKEDEPPESPTTRHSETKPRDGGARGGGSATTGV